MQYSYGAYLVPRRGGRGGGSGKSPRGRPPGGHKRGIGVLITALLLLTSAICLLVVFLPRIGQIDVNGKAPEFGGKKFYFLTTADATEYGAAFENAQVTAARGGAGYVYNDGQKYRVVASAYERESDVKALVAVNAGSDWFEVNVPAASLEKNGIAALEYLTGGFFTELYNASVELDRGNITEAAADAICAKACKHLFDMAIAVENKKLSEALERASEFSVSATRPMLSYIRYVAVRAIALCSYALT